MTFLFGTLLLIFLCGFLFLEPLTANVLQASDVRFLGMSILDPGFRVFLGLGVVFLEFVIIFFSFLDRIGDTIKAVLKPLVSLLPLSAFVFSVYKTFAPIFLSILPHDLAVQINGATVAANAGAMSGESYITQAINDGSFELNVIWTVVTMLLFAVVAATMSNRSGFTDEIRRLRAENARYKKLLQ